jgi:uncharacterized transporter YbjL
MVEGKGISIWFFIGILLFIYGIIITVANIFETLYNSFGRNVVLKSLHFGIWWGILLVILGLVYSIEFRPGKKKI